MIYLVYFVRPAAVYGSECLHGADEEVRYMVHAYYWVIEVVYVLV